MKRTPLWLSWLAGSPLLAFLLLPVLVLAARADLPGLGRQLATEATQAAMGVSLRTSAACMVVVLVFGTPLAMALSRGTGRLSSAARSLVALPVVLPPAAAGIALLLTFGRAGALGEWLSSHGVVVAFQPAAVVMAQVFVASSFYVLQAESAFATRDVSLEENAVIDGCSPVQVAWWVTLPLCGPQLLSGAMLAWARALGEFGATILFAGSMMGSTRTMPLAIFLGFETDLRQAEGLSVVLVVVAAVVLALSGFVSGQRRALV
ncbi:MAG: ABC transporter permease [Fimbriimonadaceae bacterium]|nr:ABC transporter permease [Fimbriimonadaceae bacterium]